MFARVKVLTLGVLVAAATFVLPAAAAQPAPPVDVTGELQCPGDTFVVTVANSGDQTYNVEASADPASPETATVGPNETVDIPVPLHVPGATFPFVVQVTGDNGFPATTFDPVFDCPSVIDFSVTTQEGTPVEKSDICPTFGAGESGPEHGTLKSATHGLGGFVYTPDPGFVGTDSFDYQCGGAANQLGTVTVTVTSAPAAPPPPAPAAPATPVAASPTFAG
ncbi:MAG TPA: Ig-like domain-containing protein [Acidimicrobiales bacterium]|nr:Ig-like domain-containing protein [Acidimicrobiales bacterium]